MRASSGFPGILKRIFQTNSLIKSKLSKAAESEKSGVLKNFAKPLKVASLKIDPVLEKLTKAKGGSSSKSSAMKNAVKSVTTLAKKKTTTKPQLSTAKKTAKKAKSSAVALGSAAINI